MEEEEGSNPFCFLPPIFFFFVFARRGFLEKLTKTMTIMFSLRCKGVVKKVALKKKQTEKQSLRTKAKNYVKSLKGL